MRSSFDWSGSGTQRREQGICAPAIAYDPGRRYVIPAGSPVLISREPSDEWYAYTTRRELSFSRLDESGKNFLQFKRLDWFVRIHPTKVDRNATA